MKKFYLAIVALFLTISTCAFAAPDSFVPVVNATKDGVVNIVVEGKRQSSNPFMDDEMFRRFFGGPSEYKFTGGGSGFVIDAREGYIITNNHVIENATTITVKTSDKKEYKATLVGRDSLTDLALLKIEAKGLKALTLGDSDALQIGEWVIAIGSPFGLEWTVTAGIISAKGRNIGDSAYNNFLQTDASINPGNSGGPLLNMKGEVIGINTMIFNNAQRLGFSVPVNMLKDLLPQLKGGQVRRGWMGVSLQDLTEDLATAFGLPDSTGALVASVIPGEPADIAGVRSGDIIKEIDGVGIEDSHALMQLIGIKRPGQNVRVDMIRDGKAVSVTVKLAERESEDGVRSSSGAEPSASNPIKTRELTPAEKSKIDIENGIVVTSVLADSSAAKAGLAQGQVILWLNRTDITSVRQFNELYAKIKKGDSVALRVYFQGGTRFVAFTKE